jgi:hypothetical protein
MSSPGLHRLGMVPLGVVFKLIMSRRRLVGHHTHRSNPSTVCLSVEEAPDRFAPLDDIADCLAGCGGMGIASIDSRTVS